MPIWASARLSQLLLTPASAILKSLILARFAFAQELYRAFCLLWRIA
jgi:hypothetical protein